jgi:hypothetical protein
MTIIKAVLRIHNCDSPKLKDLILVYKIMIFKLVLKNQISSHKTTSSMGGSLMNIAGSLRILTYPELAVL